jgi:XisH protein
MAALDRFYEAIKVALVKENWVITDDSLRLEAAGAKFESDLGAERLLAAERAGEKIAVEIKTFLSDSPITYLEGCQKSLNCWRSHSPPGRMARRLGRSSQTVQHQQFFAKIN